MGPKSYSPASRRIHSLLEYLDWDVVLRLEQLNVYRKQLSAVLIRLKVTVVSGHGWTGIELASLTDVIDLSHARSKARAGQLNFSLKTASIPIECFVATCNSFNEYQSARVYYIQCIHEMVEYHFRVAKTAEGRRSSSRQLLTPCFITKDRTHYALRQS